MALSHVHQPGQTCGRGVHYPGLADTCRYADPPNLPDMTDADQFRRLFDEHRTAVFGFAVRRVGRDLADEVLAETFLVAWRRLADVPADTERRWLLATARLVLTNLSRASRRRDRLLDRIEVSVYEPDHAAGVAQSLDVQRALARLRAPDQEVLRLIEWDDLSQASAAALLGCSRAAVAVRLRRARARFAKALDAESSPGLSAMESSPSSTQPSTPGPARQLIEGSAPPGRSALEAAEPPVPCRAERSFQ